MRKRVPPADLSRVRTYPLAERRNQVRVEEFGRPADPDASLAAFLDGLPGVLAARTLRDLARAVAEAVEAGRLAFTAGARQVSKTANASSPLTGFLRDEK